MTANEIKTGWRIVTGILGSVLIFSVLVRLILPLLVGRAPGLGDLVNMALTVWLCWSVYQGSGIARFILIVLLLLNAVFLLFGGSLLLAFGLIYLIFGLSLFLIPQVNRYFEYARNY